MKKTIITIIVMLLIMIIPILAASSENDEQALAFGIQQSEPEQPTQSNIIPILIIIGIAAFWYVKK